MILLTLLFLQCVWALVFIALILKIKRLYRQRDCLYKHYAISVRLNPISQDLCSVLGEIEEESK